MFRWAGKDDGDVAKSYGIWAPDEIYNPNYRWKDGSKGAYMYYFCTSSSWIHSVIGYAVSKTVHGPYKNVTPIIYSGFTKDKKENGDNNTKNDIYTNTNVDQLIKSHRISGFNSKWIRENGTYNNDYAPNAIDPNITKDSKGNLWLAYGSWSGGIYILPINKVTGQPIYPGKDGTNKYGQNVDRYFGTHLIGGYHMSGEAPYIKYDPQTKYYYLFVTYGGLNRTGGYNMRVFRSKHITSKYVDDQGHTPNYTSWETNDPTKQSNQKYGVKLEGNYSFSCLPYAYMSPGHNSVYIDNNHNWYLFNHTRFNNGTENHQLRVKQMIMTSDGWPIPLPFEYTGHELSINSSNIPNITKQIPGKYEFIDNGTDTNPNPIKPKEITLMPDHQITGAIRGLWSINQKENTLLVTLNTTEGKYVGEFKLQQDESKERNNVLVFSVQGNNKVLWGVKKYQK